MASSITDFFKTNGKALYYERGERLGLHIFFWCLIALFMAGLGYYIGYMKYDNPKTKGAFKTLRDIISNIKRR